MATFLMKIEYQTPPPIQNLRNAGMWTENLHYYMICWYLSHMHKHSIKRPRWRYQ